MARIRVLHIVWSATMGGIERLVLNLCKAQLQNPLLDVSVMIAKSEGPLLEEFKRLDLPLIEGGFRNGRDQRTVITSRLSACFAGFDVIHIHSYNPIIAKEAVRSNCKIVFTEHGNFGFGKKTTLSSLMVRFMLKRFLNHKVDYITFNSNFSKKIAEERFGLKNVTRKVIYNGVPEIDATSLNRVILKRNPGELIVGTVGRLAAVKRIDRVLTALSQISNSGIRLAIMGDGPLKEDLQTLSLQLEITEKVEFIATGDARAFMKEVDLCVLPSQNEAFGLVAIEAYQFGKPVLVFADGGGSAELVSQIEPEMIVKDEKELAEKIKFIAEHSEIRTSATVIAARKNFARQFSIEKMEAALLAVYQSL
ncbi:glycosyltransferase family 4 protein [soil metagenome]